MTCEEFPLPDDSAQDVGGCRGACPLRDALYRYRLHLLPEGFGAREAPLTHNHPIIQEGWELVSRKVAKDGAELVMYRRHA